MTIRDHKKLEAVFNTDYPVKISYNAKSGGTKRRTKMLKTKYIYEDRQKKWQVVCDGKVISKHIDFYHAQEYIPKLFRAGRINNGYEILPIKTK